MTIDTVFASSYTVDSRRLLDVEQKFKLAGVIALNISMDGMHYLVYKFFIEHSLKINDYYAYRSSSLLLGSHY